MRIIAILTAYNEQRFIAQVLEHFIEQGVEVYLVDNESTDQTAALAEPYRGRGLIDVTTISRDDGTFDVHRLLQDKERLAAELDADWFMHIDADEFHASPRRNTTLRAAVEEADAAGYNAINFLEYVFTPTLEHPDHDHPRFQETMKSYYSFQPRFPHRLNAWKKQPKIDLVSSGGHIVAFPGLKLYPESFPMRHYLCLSRQHAIEKYVRMQFNRRALDAGWSVWRSQITEEMIRFPEERELKTFVDDASLDPSNARTRHYLAEIWAAMKEKRDG